MNLRETKIVARFDYKNLVRSAPGVTFLILYLYVAINLGAWLAEQLITNVDALLLLPALPALLTLLARPWLLSKG